MLGEGALAEVSLAEGVEVGVVIIPEVAFETKELVIAVEIEFVVPA